MKRLRMSIVFGSDSKKYRPVRIKYSGRRNDITNKSLDSLKGLGFVFKMSPVRFKWSEDRKSPRDYYLELKRDRNGNTILGDSIKLDIVMVKPTEASSLLPKEEKELKRNSSTVDRGYEFDGEPQDLSIEVKAIKKQIEEEFYEPKEEKVYRNKGEGRTIKTTNEPRRGIEFVDVAENNIKIDKDSKEDRTYAGRKNL